MKRGILLIVLLSFFSVATFAQTTAAAKKKAAAAKAAAARRRAALAASKNKTKAKVDTSKNKTAFAGKISGVELVDTSKKSASYIPANFEPPVDGYYVKSAVKTARPTPYPSLREADVAVLKRVWREIDVRERMNQYLVSPKGRLIDVLMDAIMAGELTAYDATPNAERGDPNGDEFKTPLSPEAARAKMADSALVHHFDKTTGEDVGTTRVAGQYNPDSILRFRIKEDWIFDKQRSVFEPRIIGIAPLVRPKAAGQSLDFQPAFWVYFPDARRVLATHEIIMRHSDATALSFDQAFLKRIFTSYIVKVSNEKDERIKDYMQGIDQLYESEKVKKTLMDYELNLWQY